MSRLFRLALVAIALAGCASIAEVKSLPPRTGTQLKFNAGPDVVRKAAHDAVLKANCDIDEESQAPDGTSMVIGSSKTRIATFMPTMGVWIRVAIVPEPGGVTTAYVYETKRDKNDAFAATGFVSQNVTNYMKASVEEYLLDHPAPAAKPKGR